MPPAESATPLPVPPPTDTPGEINLLDLAAALWRLRGLFIALSLLIAALCGGSALAVYFLQPRQVIASLEFKLLFKGAENGRYPNETPFSPSDIIAAGVMDKVYKQNGLDKYVSFDDFRSAFAVLQRNDNVEAVDLEYRALLGDQKLSPVDRRRLEDEYAAKKKSALVPQYQLVHSAPAGKSPPAALLPKILADVLSTWAETADKEKHINQYQTPLLSDDILPKAAIEGDEPIIALDYLALTFDRLKRHAENLEKLPGAAVVHAGKSRKTLKEAVFSLENIERFKLAPLIRRVTIQGLAKNPSVAANYLQKRMNELVRRKTLAIDQQRAVLSAFDDYATKGKAPASARADAAFPERAADSGMPAIIPQLGASFFDKIIEMGQQKSDVAYKQDLTTRSLEFALEANRLESEISLYKEMLDKFAASAEKGVDSKELAEVGQELLAIHASLLDLMAFIRDFQTEIARINLDPQAQTYDTIGSATVSPAVKFPVKKVLPIAALAFLLAECAMAAILLLAGQMAIRVRPA